MLSCTTCNETWNWCSVWIWLSIQDQCPSATMIFVLNTALYSVLKRFWKQKAAVMKQDLGQLLIPGKSDAHRGAPAFIVVGCLWPSLQISNFNPLFFLCSPPLGLIRVMVTPGIDPVPPNAKWLSSSADNLDSQGSHLTTSGDGKQDFGVVVWFRC